MADIPSITPFDVSSWLRRARTEANAITWLTSLNIDATDAIAAGDQYVTVLSQEGTSSQQSRQADARFIQHVTEACLQQLAAETAAGGADKLPGPGAVRYGDFS